LALAAEHLEQDPDSLAPVHSGTEVEPVAERAAEDPHPSFSKTTSQIMAKCRGNNRVPGLMVGGLRVKNPDAIASSASAARWNL
jgi:hypothetical protein